MDILIASGNPHKQEELARLFPGYNMLLPQDYGIAYHYKESGATYLENCMGKANALYSFIHKDDIPFTGAILADDSGLSVKALNGEPGVYSSRYGTKPGEPKLSTQIRNQYLLRKMHKVKNREAFFVCCMVLFMHEYRFFIAQETLEGEIAIEPRGTHGFGYDPVFFVPETKCMLAELTASEKDLLSHRGRAAKRIRVVLKESLT